MLHLQRKFGLNNISKTYKNYDSAVLITMNKTTTASFLKYRHAFPLQKFPDNMEAYSGK